MKSNREPRHKRPFVSRLTADVDEDVYLEAELLALAFATGMQDATTFPDYHCFASNQTGNTVLLAVGIVGVGGTLFEFPNVSVSLSVFLAGGWLMGQIGNQVGCRRRLWLIISSIIQTATAFAAAALQYHAGVALTGPATLGVIALLAFSSGAQVAMARSLKVAEITTAMATGTYVDLLVDPELFLRRNRPRNRRLLFLVSLLAGSFAGAFAYVKVGSAFALLMAAVGKLVVTLALVLNGEAERAEADAVNLSCIPTMALTSDRGCDRDGADSNTASSTSMASTLKGEVERGRMDVATWDKAHEAVLSGIPTIALDFELERRKAVEAKALSTP
ncbi:hypothetical protein MMC12_008688 [Toensbergia leucococca]|nr:hypothetical protein [Toensbergia leucococca]